MLTPNAHVPINVNLKLLQTFMLVAQEKSFRAAAEKSFRSASAVSAQIRQLEEQLGVALFHRTTRNVHLTVEGEQLMECAHRAYLEVEDGLRKIRETADIQHGQVIFACSPTVAETRLARVLAAFEKEHPGISVTVHEMTSGAQFDSIRTRAVDFGIGPSIESSEFTMKPVMEDSLYALVPRRFLKTAKRTISLATLSNIPLLMLSRATALRGMLEEAMKERHLEFTTRYVFSQAQTLISMANAGLGAAILPKVTLPPREDPAAHILRITNPSLSRTVCINTLRGNKLSPAALKLVRLLQELIPDADERPGGGHKPEDNGHPEDENR